MARRARSAALVHAHGDVAGMLALPLLRRHPSLVTTHGLHLLRRARWPLRPALVEGLRAAVGAARLTICTSRSERDELAALIGEKRAGGLRVIPNGVDPPPPDPAAREAVRAELGLATGDVLALFLGQLERRKGPLTAVAAAVRARERRVPIVLAVAGEGPQAPLVAAQAGPAIRELGFRFDPERLLAAADIFILPSFREGHSFALLEAMAHGLAVVVADGPGNAEAVGEAACIVPPDDIEGLTQALASLGADAAERARLGSLARARVVERYSAERFLAEMAAVYGAVLEQA
jgi:glycosyltransferase involved in cell wall biosynthesis